MDHQKKAIELMHNGCILHGGVGTGKTFTALNYYKQKESPRDIYVITTARKRDSYDWNREAAHIGIFSDENTTAGRLHVDSWNNVKKYIDIKGAFFIFDEQRVIGTGVWVKSFLKIAKNNRWILLSATPGDTWLDYAPVFIANGYYKNITDFKRRHIIYEPFMKYPVIRQYINEERLAKLRNYSLVEMPYIRNTERIINWMDVDYDKKLYYETIRTRWNPYTDEPIKDAAELFRILRRIINSDPSRVEFIKNLIKPHDRVIVFYTFNYELDILRGLSEFVDVAEWNGQRKDDIPEGNSLVYLVQYTAGAEAWNCTTAGAMVFYSMPYSYRIFEQAQGRIDRMDTLFKELFYYVLVSNSTIDLSIRKSLMAKKTFNERTFMENNTL